MVSRLSRHVDSERIVRAIERAERQTSGQIRVSLAPHFWGDLRKAAERAFVRLGMTRTPLRNGVLLFVVPSRREFVILGDIAIHEKAGQDFWERVAAAMTQRIKDGDLTDGIVHGIETAGAELAAHFPPVPGPDGGEGALPNAVDR
jgi:uncharacterized membrane protein